MNKIKFRLDGCDISFIAEAPEDITLKQLLKQCNKIKPEWCRCGINSNDIEEYEKVEIEIDYDRIKLINEPSCKIIELEGEDEKFIKSILTKEMFEQMEYKVGEIDE